MLQAINREIELRASEIQKYTIETIYFGGGTPSVLTVDEMHSLISTLGGTVSLDQVVEVTMECNPDDLNPDYLQALLNETMVDRISIGIQSFHDPHLKMMNRAHNGAEAGQSLEQIFNAGFEKVTADLIFGLPDNDLSIWQSNLARLVEFPVSHISCYGLTIEPNTALKHVIDKGLIDMPDESAARDQFYMTQEFLASKGYEQYEISNFCLPGQYAVHNTNYWKQVPYIGIGPSAHSYNGRERRFNVANNSQYLSAINRGIDFWETELLSESDRYNEWILTGLRTKWGIDGSDAQQYSLNIREEFDDAVKKSIHAGWIEESDGALCLTKSGKVLADYVISSFFYV
ncbi:radical SAM family heme chaperone HemW [Membranihabitans marinus]